MSWPCHLQNNPVHVLVHMRACVHMRMCVWKHTHKHASLNPWVYSTRKVQIIPQFYRRRGNWSLTTWTQMPKGGKKTRKNFWECRSWYVAQVWSLHAKTEKHFQDINRAKGAKTPTEEGSEFLFLVHCVSLCKLQDSKELGYLYHWSS